jgi:hypothetical protein
MYGFYANLCTHVSDFKRDLHIEDVDGLNPEGMTFGVFSHRFSLKAKTKYSGKKNHQRRMNNKIPCAVKKAPQPRYVYTLGNLYVFPLKNQLQKPDIWNSLCLIFTFLLRLQFNFFYFNFTQIRLMYNNGN